MSDDSPVIQFDASRVRTTRELGHIVPGVLSADTIESLRERKLIREASEAVDIEPINPGEKLVGYLNEEERTLYIEILSLTGELEEMAKEQNARSFEMIANAIRRTDNGKSLLQNLDNTIMFPDEQSAEEYYAIETNLSYLRALYNFSIRNRYGHSVILGVRAGFAVVRVRSKYEIPPEVIEHYAK